MTPFRHLLLTSAIFSLAPPASAIDLEWAAEMTGEYGHGRSSDGLIRERTDDASLAIEFALGLQFDDHWRSDLIMLAEDIGIVDRADYLPSPGATDKRPDHPHLDTLTISYLAADYNITAGRYTLPFGDFATAVISDPQTLVVGETATNLGITYARQWNTLSWQLSAFNGNVRSTAADQSGFSTGIDWQPGEDWYLGIGYLSTQYALRNAPALFDLHAGFEKGAWTGHLEFTGAAASRSGQRPRAVSLDAGYSINDQWSLGGRLQRTWQSGVLAGGDGDYAEWALAVFYGLHDNIGLGLEYSHGEEGSASARQWLLQLAIEL